MSPGEQLEGLGRTSTLTDLTNTGVVQAFERVCQTAHRKLQLGVLSIMGDAADALWPAQPSVQEKAYFSPETFHTGTWDFVDHQLPVGAG